MQTATKSLLVLGGTSDLGRAAALAYAKLGWSVTLAGRDEAALAREAADLSTRIGRGVETRRLDVLATDSFPPFLDSLPALPDVALCVVGLLGDQTRAQTDMAHAAAIMRTQYEGPALLLGLIAERFLARGSGTIIGVSSVAGDRGRASNYVYGSAKAGFTAFLSGLRNRCAKGGVHVMTVKPGFMRTRMTQGMKLPAPLTAAPAAAAAAILRAAQARKDVIYVSGRWRPVMTIIRAIPERIFKKLSL